MGFDSAQSTSIPDLYDFAHIFSELPTDSAPAVAGPRHSPSKSGSRISRSVLAHLKEQLFSFFGYTRNKNTTKSLTRPAPYARLKAGRKSAIIAVVDNGTISFQRFGDVDFSELPWVGDCTMYARTSDIV